MRQVKTIGENKENKSQIRQKMKTTGRRKMQTGKKYNTKERYTKREGR